MHTHAHSYTHMYTWKKEKAPQQGLIMPQSFLHQSSILSGSQAHAHTQHEAARAATQTIVDHRGPCCAMGWPMSCFLNNAEWPALYQTWHTASAITVESSIFLILKSISDQTVTSRWNRNICFKESLNIKLWHKTSPEHNVVNFESNLQEPSGDWIFYHLGGRDEIQIAEFIRISGLASWTSS